MHRQTRAAHSPSLAHCAAVAFTPAVYCLVDRRLHVSHTEPVSQKYRQEQSKHSGQAVITSLGRFQIISVTVVSCSNGETMTQTGKPQQRVHLVVSSDDTIFQADRQAVLDGEVQLQAEDTVQPDLTPLVKGLLSHWLPCSTHTHTHS